LSLELPVRHPSPDTMILAETDVREEI
jgi:hypothetical protein